MIEKISLALVDESGNVLPLKQRDAQLEIKLEEAIADLFSKICCRNNSIEDQEIKINEKYIFALNLQNYLKETKETYAE